MKATVASHAAIVGGEHVVVKGVNKAIKHGVSESVSVLSSPTFKKVAPPGVGVAATSVLTYQSVHHAVDSAKEGNKAAVGAYSAAATIDAGLGAAHVAHIKTGKAVMSHKVTMGLSVAAIGLASTGAYLDTLTKAKEFLATHPCEF